MSFDRIMQSFAHQKAMDTLEYHDNKYHLTLEDSIEVSCFQANGCCYIHGLLTAMPADEGDGETLLVELLNASLALAYSHRLSLCLEPDGQHLAVCLVRSLQGFDALELDKALIEFAHGYELLQQICDQPRLDSPSGPMVLMP